MESAWKEIVAGFSGLSVLALIAMLGATKCHVDNETSYRECVRHHAPAECRLAVSRE